MTVTASLIVFAMLWFLTLFVVLPIGVRTQGEAGEVAPGTPSSAPADGSLKRKFIWVTAIAFVLWALICSIILWGGITIDDIDVWGI